MPKNIKGLSQKVNGEMKEPQRLQDLKEFDDADGTSDIDNLIVAKKKSVKVYAESMADKTYRSLIEKMQEGAVITNEDGIIIYCNSSFAEMINSPLQNITGIPFRSFIGNSSKEGFKKLLTQARNTATSQKVNVHTNDGKTIPVIMSVNIFLVDGNWVTGIILTDINVQSKKEEEFMLKTKATEEKNFELKDINRKLVIQTNENVTQNEDRKKDEANLGQLAAIVQSSDDAIISKSLEGIIKTWNKGSEKMFGYTEEEALGKPITLIIPPEYIHEEIEILKRISINETIHYETVRIKKNGEQFYVSITVSPLKDFSGKIAGASKIARDISVRKKIELELVRNNKELALQLEENIKCAEERKKDEEHIGQLAAIVESSDDAIISKSLDGIIKTWNKGSEKMFGYTEEEALGKPITLIIPPEYIHEENEILKRISINETMHYETVRKKKTGEQFYVSIAISPLKNLAGKIIGASKIARDISVRKKSELELVRSNRELALQLDENIKRAEERKKDEEHIGQLAAIVESSDDAIISKSLDGIIKTWNKGSEKMFGYTEEEALGKPITLIIPPEYIHEEKEILKRISINETIHYETVRKKKNEEQFYVSITVSPLKDLTGKIIGASKIARDISARKKSELELVRSNRELASQVDENIKRAEERKKDEEHIGQLAAIVSSSDDAIISKSLDGIIKTWNKGSERMFGYTEEEALGKPITLIIPPEYIYEENEILKRISINETVHYETVRKKKNGQQFYVSITISPLKDLTGKITGASKIARDISVRKKSESELVRSNKELAFQIKEKEKRESDLIILSEDLKAQQKELRRANEEILVLNKNLEKRVFERTRELENLNHELKDLNLSKDKFLSVISHDLRNPLTALLLSSDLLIRETESDIFDSVQPYIKVISNTSYNILQQLNELVDWAQKQRERTSLNLERIQLVFNVDLSLELLKTYARQKNIVLENKVRSDIYVTVDILMLRSILQNLVTNSIKYTPDGGLITITAQPVDNMIEVSVTDTGIGMDEVISKNLFINSNSTSASGTNNEKGTGMGLTLVKDFVKQHKGNIRTESELGKGTSIIFTLPE